MKYIAVCEDMCGNIFEMSFNSREERTDFIMRSCVRVLFTKEEYRGVEND